MKHPFVSVFDRVWDHVVFGTGWVGLAVIRRLLDRGEQVLWVSPGNDLLWESTRALELSMGSEATCPWEAAWPFLKPEGELDAVRLEASLAGWLRRGAVATLLEAMPVGVTLKGRDLAEVQVATKAGIKRLRAGAWVDATEEGLLALHAGRVSPRSPEARWWNGLVHTDERELLTKMEETAVLPTTDAALWRLRWREGEEPPHRVWMKRLQALRRTTGDSGWRLVATGELPFPIYPAGGGGWSGDVDNLEVQAPALRHERLTTLAERYALGAAGSASLVIGDADRAAHPAAVQAEVVVAGGGTAGAVAGIAAARGGADVLLFDLAPYPGGIGTAGGVSGYFHGASGGLQDEIDLQCREWSRVLTGTDYGLNRWHREARRWALLEAFSKAKVRHLPYAMLCGVEQKEGRVRSIQVAVGGRLLTIAAPAFIDATGDGDLCAMAGAPYVHGRPGDARPLAYSQTAYSVMPTSTSAGAAVLFSNFDAGWVDPTNPEDLTRARLEGLSQYLQFQRRPGEVLVQFAPLLGLRQSRQIATDYAVTLGDLLAGRRFGDSIGRVDSVLDTHSVDFEFESDETAFYLWCCRGFRHRLEADLPYRMLLAQGLTNVWIACRAAGISVEAAYAVRMQREMQRLGEAAGLAAALAVKGGGIARSVDRDALREALEASGAKGPDEEAVVLPSLGELLTALAEGKPGVWLWHLYRRMEEDRVCREAVMERLSDTDGNVSFCAAMACAMVGEQAAETRLLQALRQREVGPKLPPVPGAFGQDIDLPRWLQAVVLLRRVGSLRAVEPLCEVVAEAPFNVLTIVARTAEALAERLECAPELVALAKALARQEATDALLPPSRSLGRELRGDAQKTLPNDRGPDTRHDHRWQLALVLGRLSQQLGLPLCESALRLADDPRAHVRRAALLQLQVSPAIAEGCK